MGPEIAPQSLGFVLFDSEWRVNSASPEAVAAITAEIDSVEAALQNFGDEVARRMQSGTPPKTFSYAGCTCTLLSFSCSYGGTTEPVNAALIRSPRGASAHVPSLSQVFHLTPRETETLTLCLRGLGVKQIAQNMGISVSTAKSFIRLVSIKMGVTSRAEILSKVLDTMCNASMTCPFRPRQG